MDEIEYKILRDQLKDAKIRKEKRGRFFVISHHY